MLFGCLLFLGGVRRFRQNPIQRYAKANGISMDQYPEELLSLYERNNETETFVEEYPLKKEEEPEIDLSDLSSASEVPLLLQWDQRWGYHRYAGEVMGLSGCGPTALSMVAIFMTGDITKNPRWVADFASQNGYAVDGSGTAWSLMLEGARQIGLSSKEIPVERERVENNLQAGNLIIALMGPGEFTSNGHFIVLTGLLFGCLLFLGGVRRFRQNPIQRYAKANGISMDQYPEELLSLYERNNETETFVEEYPLKKEEEPEIDLSDLSSASEVPLLLQWDQRWGYHRYAGEVMGLSGCGPTALSMVAIFMTGDITKNPRWVADFASQNGYAVDGSGTAWSLMLEGARQIGLSSKEIPVERERVENNLQAGNLIIALMGPGEFTSNGHFIVLTGLQNGRLKINDPNSRKNSEKTWDIDQVLEQTKAVWVYYK